MSNYTTYAVTGFYPGVEQRPFLSVELQTREAAEKHAEFLVGSLNLKDAQIVEILADVEVVERTTQEVVISNRTYF